MAQTEDTELRDLVIEALEKNGSLAKIRALLRANVFLAFENDYENMKQNVSLEGLLKLPEGVLCLSIVHEFLEFCNLKNTLFVYMAESRQGKEYTYDRQKLSTERLNLPKRDNLKEPILVTLLKNVLKPCQSKYSHEKCSDNNHKDDQNCTYIVHEDSSTGTSNSDNSSDEKSKLHLRLHLDNSDTDTSSDSARDKSSSEYIPNNNVSMEAYTLKPVDGSKSQFPTNEHAAESEKCLHIYANDTKKILHDLKLINNSSSDSTSYVDLKPFTPVDKKMLNTTGVPLLAADDKKELDELVPVTTQSVSEHTDLNMQDTHSLKNGSNVMSPTTLSSVSSISPKDIAINNEIAKSSGKSPVENSGKSEMDTAEYTYDFSSSPERNKSNLNKQSQSTGSTKNEFLMKSPKNTSLENQHQNSQSSQSSISISDVADLISEKSSSSQQMQNEINSRSNLSPSANSKKGSTMDQNKVSDDSGDFSESPVPSVSNLSLDIHSD